jgi:hypothetical protein
VAAHIHIPKAVWWITAVLAVLLVVRISRSDETHYVKPTVRTQQVQVVDWRSVDASVRKAFVTAEEKASAYAERAVKDWTDELRQRADEDFIPWYFAYWNQQALMLKTAGFYLMDTPLVEGMIGGQPSAQEQVERYLEAAFVTRVIQPATAQLRVETMTREAVKVYLVSLNEELQAVEASYRISDQEWVRHMAGLAGMIGSVEGNRQVPLMLKGVTVAGSAGAVKIGRSVSEQIKLMMLRHGRRELMEDSMYYGGRTAARGLGWVVFAGFTVWDVYDHYRTVSQNTPVMRRLLDGFFEELENQVLNDPQNGIYSVLESVRQKTAEEYKKEL